MNKHVLISEREQKTGQIKDATEVYLSNPVSFAGVTYRRVGDE